MRRMALILVCWVPSIILQFWWFFWGWQELHFINIKFLDECIQFIPPTGFALWRKVTKVVKFIISTTRVNSQDIMVDLGNSIIKCIIKFRMQIVNQLDVRLVVESSCSSSQHTNKNDFGVTSSYSSRSFVKQVSSFASD